MNLETLLIEREITRRIHAFARAMDYRDWDTLTALMTPDCRAEFGTGEITGAGEISAYIRSFLERCGTSQHLIGNVDVDVDGGTAASRAYVSDLHLAKDNNPDVAFRTLGEYHDEWVLSDGNWLLARRIKDNRATLGSMDVFG